MVLPGACFLWSTILRSGWSSRWCRLGAGAACQSWRLLEEFPLLRCLLCRAVRTWKSGHFSFALVSFSACSCVGVASGVQRIGHFGRSCVHLHLVRRWINVLREALDEFTHFRRCGELESRGVWPPFSQNGEACTIDASGCTLRAARMWKLSIISRVLYMAVCDNFCCVVQHFSSPR